MTAQPGTANGGGSGAVLTSSYQYYGLNAEADGSGIFGQLQRATDPNGAVTRYNYDAWGRLTEDAPAGRQPGRLHVALQRLRLRGQRDHHLPGCAALPQRTGGQG